MGRLQKFSKIRIFHHRKYPPEHNVGIQHYGIWNPQGGTLGSRKLQRGRTPGSKSQIGQISEKSEKSRFCLIWHNWSDTRFRVAATHGAMQWLELRSGGPIHLVHTFQAPGVIGINYTQGKYWTDQKSRFWLIFLLKCPQSICCQ